MLASLTRLQRYYLLYTGGFLMFVGALAVLEQHGMPPRWIGYSFLIFTISMYAVIGIMSRTSDVSEFYVAGRRVPAFFNGMATGADWMSAASFIGLAGTLYLSGYQGLAFVLGWTGGFVLVALLLAPYLRRFGEFTIPDFLSARYGGNAIRLVAVGATILASFVYVVAQIYGVGVITSRFVSLQFEIGVFVGLAGILVCSFLGGMRAVTWTQVAQYVILIVAYLTPVAILSWSVTGIPVPQVVYGQVLQQVQQMEDKLFDSPAEVAARRLYRERADEYARKIAQLPDSLSREREQLSSRINELKASDAQVRDIVALERQRRDLPPDPDQARLQLGGRDVCRRRARGPAGPSCSRVPGRPCGGRVVAAHQLPGAGLLSDGGHGGAAAPADALLHDAECARSARIRLLVAVVHPRALFDRARLCRICQARGSRPPR